MPTENAKCTPNLETTARLVTLALSLCLAGACGDKASFVTVSTVVTFNLGLADGFVPLARERLPVNVTAIAASDHDALCLREMRGKDDTNALIDAQGMYNDIPSALAS